MPPLTRHEARDASDGMRVVLHHGGDIYAADLVAKNLVEFDNIEAVAYPGGKPGQIEVFVNGQRKGKYTQHNLNSGDVGFFAARDYKEELTKELKKQKEKGLNFVQCIYKKKEQEKIIKGIFDNYVNDIKCKSNELSKSPDERSNLISEYLKRFLEIAPKLKKESFKDEKEWRIVSLPLKDSGFVKFREGRSTIIPYININIDERGYMPIKEIIISPISHKQLSIVSVNSLLSCEEIKPCKVKFSKISYRAL